MFNIITDNLTNDIIQTSNKLLYCKKQLRHFNVFNLFLFVPVCLLCYPYILNLFLPLRTPGKYEAHKVNTKRVLSFSVVLFVKKSTECTQQILLSLRSSE